MSAVCQAKQFWQINKIIYNCQTIQTISISIYAWPDISGKYAGQNAASTMPIKYAHNNGAACSCCLCLCLCCYCYCCNSFWPKTKGQSNECPKLLNFYLKRTTQRGKKMCACIGRQWAWLGTMRERVCSCQRQQTTLIEFKVSKCRVLCAMQRQSYFFCPGKVLQTTQGTCTHCTHTHSGANCTIGTEARTERARKAQKNSVRTRNSM